MDKYYGQHGEDKFINELLTNRGLKIPNTIIDIGALTGLHNSNSRYFLINGWEGILIEPNPDSFNELVKNTKGLPCVLENVAISDKDGEVKFKRVKKIPGHSNINENGDILVKTMSFISLIKKYPKFKKLGILDIDVEGHEEIILNNVMDSGVRPNIIIIEHQNKKDKMQYQRMILNKEYDLVNTISVNDIWLKK